MKIYDTQLLCPNPRMLHLLFDVHVLVLIAWVRYIYIIKKAPYHHLLGKGRL